MLDGQTKQKKKKKKKKKRNENSKFRFLLTILIKGIFSGFFLFVSFLCGWVGGGMVCSFRVCPQCVSSHMVPC